MYIYWILLGLAVATEITGTLSMKWASVSEGKWRLYFNAGDDFSVVYILSFAVKRSP